MSSPYKHRCAAGKRAPYCQRPGTTNREGKWYCAKCDPQRVEAERKKQTEQLRQRRKAAAMTLREGRQLLRALGVRGCVERGAWVAGSDPYRFQDQISISFAAAKKIIERLNPK